MRVQRDEGLREPRLDERAHLRGRVDERAVGHQLDVANAQPRGRAEVVHQVLREGGLAAAERDVFHPRPRQPRDATEHLARVGKHVLRGLVRRAEGAILVAVHRGAQHPVDHHRRGLALVRLPLALRRRALIEEPPGLHREGREPVASVGRAVRVARTGAVRSHRARLAGRFEAEARAPRRGPPRVEAKAPLVRFFVGQRAEGNRVELVEARRHAVRVAPREGLAEGAAGLRPGGGREHRGLRAHRHVEARRGERGHRAVGQLHEGRERLEPHGEQRDLDAHLEPRRRGRAHRPQRRHQRARVARHTIVHGRGVREERNHHPVDARVAQRRGALGRGDRGAVRAHHHLAPPLRTRGGEGPREGRHRGGVAAELQPFAAAAEARREALRVEGGGAVVAVTRGAAGRAASAEVHLCRRARHRGSAESAVRSGCRVNGHRRAAVTERPCARAIARGGSSRCRRGDRPRTRRSWPRCRPRPRPAR